MEDLHYNTFLVFVIRWWPTPIWMSVPIEPNTANAIISSIAVEFSLPLLEGFYHIHTIFCTVKIEINSRNRTYKISKGICGGNAATIVVPWFQKGTVPFLCECKSFFWQNLAFPELVQLVSESMWVNQKCHLLGDSNFRIHKEQILSLIGTITLQLQWVRLHLVHLISCKRVVYLLLHCRRSLVLWGRIVSRKCPHSYNKCFGDHYI